MWRDADTPRAVEREQNNVGVMRHYKSMWIIGLWDVQEVLISELRQLCQFRQQDDGPRFGSRKQN
jgi:hypothetical protein